MTSRADQTGNTGDRNCPQCGQQLTNVGAFWICPEHGQIPSEKPFAPLRIFLSYGHDSNEDLVRQIKADLEKRGHDVWFDKSEIKGGHDWRRSITEGIVDSHRVLSFLSKYSTRDPGVCLDEIAIAIGVKGGNIQTVLVESEAEVKPPPSISHIQWLDMHDWNERRAAGKVVWEKWYQEKLAEIVGVVESDESRRFAGEIKTLEEHLKPISSDSRIFQLLKKGLVGRAWLVEAIEQWRNAADRASRLFWIMGAPGVGKSAFAAHLAHYGRDKVIAVQFCEYDKPDHRSAHRIVRTLAFQIAARLPDYRKLLLTLPEITELDRKNPAELFDYLLADPLRHAIDGGRERYLIVIDALDEAGGAGRNELVEMLARNAPRLPDWLGIIVTSRPEKDVIAPLQGLNPFILDTATDSNRADIRDYLRRELASRLQNRADADRLVEQILEKSEGVFLYVERFCDDVQRGHLSLDHPEQFPQGLGGIFFQYFQRQFPDLEKFRKDVRPALRAILAACEPLPIEILQRLFNWQDEELRDFTRPLGSLFPVTTERGEEIIKPYHKSLADWLSDEEKASSYYVSSAEGHRLFADYGWKAYRDDLKASTPYVLAHLVEHLISAGRWENAAEALMNLFYLEARNEAGQLFDLILDFDRAEACIPIDYSHRHLVSLLREALRRDVHFIARHGKDYPQALFQCLWNSCWWYDSDEAEKHYIASDDSSGLGRTPWRQDRPRLCELLESWSRNREKAKPGFVWLRSLRPPKTALGVGLCATLNGHQGRVQCLAYSPDGFLIASGGADGLRVWNSSTLQELFYRPIEAKSVEAISFCPNSQRIVSVDTSGVASIWDARTGAEQGRWQLENFSGRVAVSKDARFAAVGADDGTLRMFDTSTWAELYSFKAHRGPFKHVEFAAVSNSICTHGRDNLIRVWDLDSRSETRRFEIQNVTALALSPAGNLLAVTTRSTIKLRVLDIVSGSDKMSVCVEKPSGGRVLLDSSIDSAQSVGFSSDARQVITGGGDFDKAVRVWDVASGKELACLAQDSSMSSIACSPDGKFVAGASSFGAIMVWSSGISGFFGPVLRDSHPQGSQAQVLGKIVQLKFSPTGREILAGSLNHIRRLWECTTGQLLRTAFTPLDLHEILSRWWHEEAILTKAIGPSFFAPSWDFSARGQDSVLVEHETKSAIAWFSQSFSHSLVHPIGLVAGANDDHLVLLSLEKSHDNIKQRVEQREARLLDLLYLDENRRKGTGRATWKEEELLRGFAILADATRLFRQLEETGEMPWPALEPIDEKDLSQVRVQDTRIFSDAARIFMDTLMSSEQHEQRSAEQTDEPVPSNAETILSQMLPLKNANLETRLLALQILVAMHHRAESVFFNLRNEAAIAACRPQRDALLTKMLDTQEAIAANSPERQGQFMKVGAADAAIEHAIFLEERNELESAMVLYKRAERIYREIADHDSVTEAMEFQLDVLRKQMRDA
jgi:WD40 repeat protein